MPSLERNRVICDIAVRAAHFQVAVQATKELLFENEIYQPGQQRQLDQHANFLMQDCEIHSYEQGVEWVRLNVARLQSVVADAMRPVLTPMGWQTLWVQAVDPGTWQIGLEPANGDPRKDESLVQVPKV